MTKNNWKPISEYNSEVHGDIVLVCGGTAYIGYTHEEFEFTSPILAIQLEDGEWVEATVYSEFYAELNPTHFMMVPEPV